MRNQMLVIIPPRFKVKDVRYVEPSLIMIKETGLNLKELEDGHVPNYAMLPKGGDFWKMNKIYTAYCIVDTHTNSKFAISPVHENILTWEDCSRPLSMQMKIKALKSVVGEEYELMLVGNFSHDFVKSQEKNLRLYWNVVGEDLRPHMVDDLDKENGKDSHKTISLRVNEIGERLNGRQTCRYTTNIVTTRNLLEGMKRKVIKRGKTFNPNIKNLSIHFPVLFGINFGPLGGGYQRG
eukprot:TRINITY_DN664_c0_g1_i2.p1 TRINITY_DN664_c0_g1~~TRINITY_DN664_c0_g1_i2.p1  ORF type:complete len:237 (-),score=26.75 TRINITY_DN664_c0_g1_i2:148-858(-)